MLLLNLSTLVEKELQNPKPSSNMNETKETAEGTAEVGRPEEHKEKNEARQNNPREERKPSMGEDGKPTIGEELFLVHLSRHQGEQPSEEDFDYECPRKKQRSVSVGEELWNVHMCRNKGMEQDFDEEPSGNSISTQRTRKTRAGSKSSKPERCSGRLASVLHLRSRDVQKRIIS